MSAPRMIKIAYPENQLVQRYIGSRQVQGKELEFFLSDGAIRKGFVTGIDDDSIQITRIPDLTSSLLSIAHIIEISETGLTFNDLPEDQRESAQKFTKIFRRVSENELNGKDS